MRHSTKSYPENVTDPSPPHRNQSRVQQHQPTTHRPDALTLRHLTIRSHGQLKSKKGINTHTLLQILTLSFLKEWCAESCRIPDLNSFHLFSCDLTATTYRRKIWIKHMRYCLFMGLWLSSHSPTHNDSGDLGSILHFKICTMQCSISATNHSTADDGSLMQIDFIKQWWPQ